MNVQKVTSLNTMGKYWPAIFTASYSLFGSYLLASYSNRHEYRFERESWMNRLSLANGGLGGLFFSKYFGKTYPITFAYTIFGFILGNSYNQFSSFIKERHLAEMRKSKTA